MKIIAGLLSLILTYLLVVGLHELGHALAARFFAIQIQHISLGFGKPLFKFKSQAGYEWIIGRYPLGGYVKLLNTRIQSVNPTQWAVCFDKQAVWIRCIVLLSGSLMNAFVGWFCFFGMELIGYQRALPIIKTITPTSIAAQAGLRAGDQLIIFNHQPIQAWQQAATLFISALGQKQLSLTVKNTAGEIRQTHLDLSHWHSTLSSKSMWEQMGIQPNYKKKYIYPPQSPFSAAKLATYNVNATLGFFIRAITQIIKGNLPLFFLMGPLSFIDLAIHSFLQSLTSFLYFIGSLSLAVGLVNLLPLPGLDGSGILYAFIEKIRQRPMSVAWEILLYQLTMILFFMILAQLLANDLRALGTKI